MSGEKSKMLDLTRDKPIKVSVRVAVPVHDHPKFNFVGKLLGPKGNSMKRLQEETMCKMAVLGRGSVKDRKKEEELRLSGDPRFNHLCDDLHVEISTFAAPAEAHARIAYALAEIRRFLVPDYHDDIRQEQLWEMQSLITSSNFDINTEFETNENSSMSDSSQISNQYSCENEVNFNQNTNNFQMENGKSCIITSLTTSVTAVTAKTTTAAAALLTTCTPATTLTTTTSTNVIGDNKMIIAGYNDTILNNITPINALTTLPYDINSILLGTPEIHPTDARLLNGIGGNIIRKRHLLGVPRTTMNSTKRTVLSFLARAKSSQSLYGNRSNIKGIKEILDQSNGTTVPCPEIKFQQLKQAT